MDSNLIYPPEVPLKSFDLDPQEEPQRKIRKERPYGLIMMFLALLTSLIWGSIWAYQKWIVPSGDRKPTMAVSALINKVMDRNNMAQPLKHPHRVFVDTKGMVYVQQDMPIFVHISVSDDAKAQKYQLTGQNATPMHLDGPGEHHLRHTHTERGGAELNVFNMKSDAAAPKIWTTYNGAERFTKDSTIFYGKGLQSDIKSEDDISGLNKSYVSIDGTTFIENKSVLSFDKEKAYSLRYYAVDNVGNAGSPKEDLFVVDLTTPKSKHELVMPFVNETISPQTTVKLHATDALSGVRKIYYRFDEESTYHEYNGNAIPLAPLTEGNHVLYYHAIDNVGNREPDNAYRIYFDQTVPISKSGILGDQFYVNDRQYVSPRTTIQLSATDNKIGVSRIEYQINDSGFKRYAAPFFVPQNNGEYRIDFRSTDHVENTSSPQRMVVWMDLEKPISKYVFDGPTFFLRDTLYITTRTKLTLPASDQFSTIRQVNYKRDTDPQRAFSQPFIIQGRGFHEVYFNAVDQVNNKEAQQRVAFVVDDRPPQIFSHMSANKYEDVRDGSEVLGVYPQLTQIFLAATDDISGTKTIWYSINGGPEQLFRDPIRNLKQGVYTVDIRAQDNVTNESRSRVRFAIGRF